MVIGSDEQRSSQDARAQGDEERGAPGRLSCEQKPGGHWRKVQAIGVVLLSFIAAALVIRYRGHVQHYLETIGPMRYPLAILVMAIVASAPFSVTDALAIMNGVLFGPLWGSVVNALGIIAAAIIGYAIGRTTSHLLEVEKYLEKLPPWVKRFKTGSPLFLIAVRIIPGLGGTVATNVAAAFRVPLIVHVWTMSAIAIPICTLLAIFGDEVSLRVAQFYHEHRPHMPHFRRHRKPSPPPLENVTFRWSFDCARFASSAQDDIARCAQDDGVA